MRRQNTLNSIAPAESLELPINELCQLRVMESIKVVDENKRRPVKALHPIKQMHQGHGSIRVRLIDRKTLLLPLQQNSGILIVPVEARLQGLVQAALMQEGFKLLQEPFSTI